MNQQQLRSGSENTQSEGKYGPSGWLMGIGLALAAAVAITIAIYVSRPPADSSPAANGASNVVARGETSDQHAHDDPSFHAPQTLNNQPADRSFHTPQTSNYVGVNPSIGAQIVPNAADQGVMNYLRAHGFGATNQTVPSAADQGVMNYLRAHGFGITGQTVPSAADQGVMNYLRAHGFGATNQTVPSAADQGVMNYLRAHGAFLATRSGLDYLRVPNSVRVTYVP